VLVITLVVALPAAMAVCSASTLGLDGSGSGDLVAAALSGLDRDLHGARIHTAPARDPLSCMPAFAAGTLLAVAPEPRRATTIDGDAAPPRPADALAGPGADGHPFLF
jgi:hypothetical protein